MLSCLSLSIVSAGEIVSEQYERMQPCPSSPNCVSSKADPGSHYIEPLVSVRDAQALMAAIKLTLEEDSGFSVVESDDTYLHAEARTRFFGFVDDVEFQIHQDSNVVDVRSGSRVGYSDLGKNRRRLEAIRQSLAKQGY